MSKHTAILIDVLCIVAFAAVGRASHAEPFDVLGILGTASPFLAGAGVGWLIVMTMLRRMPLISQGAVVLGDTLIIGLLLRMAGGSGIGWPFPLITAVVLALLLLGWRMVYWWVRGRRDEGRNRRRRG